MFLQAGRRDGAQKKVDWCYKHTEPEGLGGILQTSTLNCYHVHLTRRRLLKRVNGHKAGVWSEYFCHFTADFYFILFYFFFFFK